MPWFAVRGNARAFDEVSLPELAAYRPETIAGSIAALRILSEASLCARARWPSLTYGILALTSTGQPSLAEEDRGLFWEAFGMPVWEQCRRWDGTLYAEECAARQGLHLRVADMPSVADGAALIHDPCACGDPSPRLVAVPERERILIAAASASAA